MKSVDKSMVLDLLTLIDDDRRYQETSAVLSTHPVQRARYAAVSRKEAALVSAVRQGMARLMCGNPSASEQARQLDAYVRLLVDNYLDGNGGASAPAGPQPHKRTSSAQTRPTQPTGRRT